VKSLILCKFAKQCFQPNFVMSNIYDQPTSPLTFFERYFHGFQSPYPVKGVKGGFSFDSLDWIWNNP
ncbi:hypothetical protein AA980_05830, partial [Neobacillus vireti]